MPHTSYGLSFQCGISFEPSFYFAWPRAKFSGVPLSAVSPSAEAVEAPPARPEKPSAPSEKPAKPGRPAKPLKELSDAAIAGMRMGVAHYAENAKHHAAAVFEADLK